MSTEVRHRRGTTAQHATFTGALAEITVDTDKKTAVVHDGATAGGIPLAREDGKNDGAFGYQQDVKTNDYAVVVGDIGKMLVANKATAINFTLGTAAALTSKFVAGFKNIGVGVLSITPNGAEQIDGVSAAITVPAGASLILKGDGTSFRTFVGNGDVTGAAIHNAASKAALADADEMGVIDTAASNILKKFTLANLISSIFKTARTIVNAQFDAASFKLFNAAGTPRALTIDTTALTADAVLKVPAGGADLTSLRWIYPARQTTTSGTSKDFSSLPAGIKEFEVVFNGVSLSGTDDLLVQLGTGGVPQATGYAQSSSRFTAGVTTTSVTSGFPVSLGVATRTISGWITFKKNENGSNQWDCSYSLGGADATHIGGGTVSLSGALDIVRLAPSGSNTFDTGSVDLRYKL